MDSRTGEVMPIQEMLKRIQTGDPQDAQYVKEIDPQLLSERNRLQLAATGRTTISRNSPCPCGSRKRFKRCCYTGIGRYVVYEDGYANYSPSEAFESGYTLAS